MSTKLVKNSQKKQQESTAAEVLQNLLEYLTVLFGIIMAGVLVFYMQEGYVKIGTAKFNVYAHVCVFGMPLLLLLAIFWLLTEKQEKQKKFRQRFSTTDLFLLAFLLLALISFFASGDLKACFWGYDGWYMGLFAQLTFVLLYFVFSRFCKDGKLVLTALCLFAAYAFVIGILHRLLIDPIGVYDNISDFYKNQFLSTMGQASWYSSFVCSILPLGVFCFYLAQKTWIRICSGIFTFTGFMTLVSQNTDSAYIASTAVFLLLLFVSVKSAGRMIRLCEIGLMYFLAPKAMWLLLKIHPNEILELDTISNTLLFDSRVWILPVICLLFMAFFYLLDKKGKYATNVMVVIRNIFYGLVVAGILSSILILVLSAKGKLSGIFLMLSEKIPYLTWEAQWGNGRGFTWSFTGKMIAEMSLPRKLFGVGPDHFAGYAYSLYEEELNWKWGNNVLTNAHNEWVNMIVDYGFLGAAAYIGFFLSALVRFVKNSEDSPVLLCAAGCIVSYMGHNLFCYQQVLCTPFVFLVIALAEYQLRRKAGHESA